MRTDFHQQRKAAWEGAFGHLEDVRNYFGRPYAMAVTPLLVNSIKDSIRATDRRPSARILVLTGRKGNFRRFVLPELQKHLNIAAGKTVRLQLVEHEYYPSVYLESKAPGPTDEDAKLPFEKESFNVVYGASVLHGDLELPERVVREAKRVTKPGGAIIHVQDHIPAVDIWGQHGRDSSTRNIPGYLWAHSSLADHVVTEVGNELNLTGQVIPVRGQTVTTDLLELPLQIRERMDVPAPNASENLYSYQLGRLGYGKSPFAGRNRQLEYGGIATVLTKPR